MLPGTIWPQEPQVTAHSREAGGWHQARALRCAGIIETMSKSSARRFTVTVTRLPVTRCQICHRTVTYRPGTLSKVLTEHYRRAHLEALGLDSR
jgi:hypothetical protein